MAGLNFVGTDVLLSPAVAPLVVDMLGSGLSIHDALREVAELGYSFKAIDAVTYEAL